MKLRGSTVSKRVILLFTIGLVFSMLSAVSCSETETDNHVSEKASSQLLAQVTLRREQIAEPSSDRLELMKNMGMMVDKLEIQRIFIHLTQALNNSQIAELESMGITVYLDSWIPPVGAHPTGFLIADMPVDKLEELAEKDYVIELDTAERTLQPQNGFKPQVE